MRAEYPDPHDCPHMAGESVDDHRVCTYSGSRVWVNCTASLCGEPPRCSYAPIDNSPEAMERRVQWLRANRD